MEEVRNQVIEGLQQQITSERLRLAQTARDKIEEANKLEIPIEITLEEMDTLLRSEGIRVNHLYGRNPHIFLDNLEVKLRQERYNTYSLFYLVWGK